MGARDRDEHGSAILLLHPLQWEVATEGAAAAEGALHFELSAVTLQHVFHDSESETGTAGRARTSGVDAVKTLCQPRNMLRGNAHASVGHREVGTLVVHPPPHLNRALGRCVLRRVVDEVGERGMDLGLVADEMRVGIDTSTDVFRVRQPLPSHPFGASK